MSRQRVLAILKVAGIVTLVFWFVLSNFYYHDQPNKATTSFVEACAAGTSSIIVLFAFYPEREQLKEFIYRLQPRLNEYPVGPVIGFICFISIIFCRTVSLLLTIFLIQGFLIALDNIYWQVALGFIIVISSIRFIPLFYTDL